MISQLDPTNLAPRQLITRTGISRLKCSLHTMFIIASNSLLPSITFGVRCPAPSSADLAPLAHWQLALYRNASLDSGRGIVYPMCEQSTRMPLQSDLHLASEKFSDDAVSAQTSQLNEQLIRILNSAPKWFDVRIAPHILLVCRNPVLSHISGWRRQIPEDEGEW